MNEYSTPQERNGSALFFGELVTYMCMYMHRETLELYRSKEIRVMAKRQRLPEGTDFRDESCSCSLPILQAFPE